MAFSLSATSLSHTSHVAPAMMAVALLAIELTSQDFGFTEEQSRTAAEEAAKVASGASHTLHSHHLINPATGFSEALDAVPFADGKFVWDWNLIFPVAAAFKAASTRLATPITWGAVWDRLMGEIPGDDAAAMRAGEVAYIARRRSAGHHNVFVDGPHFELGRN
ncbi:MAG TPA: M15 family peptidase [Caulobacteraceae bacterium]